MGNASSIGADDFRVRSWSNTAPPFSSSPERPSTPPRSQSAEITHKSTKKGRFAQLQNEILVERKASFYLMRRISSMEETERSTRGELEKLRERLRAINEQMEKNSLAIGELKLEFYKHHRTTVSHQQSLEFKLSEMLHKAQLEVDGAMHKISWVEKSNILGKFKALEKNLESIRSDHSESMAVTNRDIEILQTSHHQAARLVASLNRLGFKFGPLDLRYVAPLPPLSLSPPLCSLSFPSLLSPYLYQQPPHQLDGRCVGHGESPTLACDGNEDSNDYTDSILCLSPLYM